jgi:hypothetical protein
MADKHSSVTRTQLRKSNKEGGEVLTEYVPKIQTGSSRIDEVERRFRSLTADDLA